MRAGPEPAVTGCLSVGVTVAGSTRGRPPECCRGTARVDARSEMAMACTAPEPGDGGPTAAVEPSAALRTAA